MSTDGQGTKCHRNIAKNLNRLSRARALWTTHRRTTDGQATAYNERECPAFYSSLVDKLFQHLGDMLTTQRKMQACGVASGETDNNPWKLALPRISHGQGSNCRRGCWGFPRHWSVLSQALL